MDPQVVATHFHLRHDDAVADFGAGGGNFIPILSRAVGSNGRVYACEIQKNLVEKLGALIREKHLSNVRPLWSDLEAPHGTTLGDGILDAGFLINTLFQIEQKKQALEEIARTMRKGAKLFIIDWTDSFGGLGPHPKQVVMEITARALAEATGFTSERTFPAGDHHYGLACRRM